MLITALSEHYATLMTKLATSFPDVAAIVAEKKLAIEALAAARDGDAGLANEIIDKIGHIDNDVLDKIYACDDAIAQSDTVALFDVTGIASIYARLQADERRVLWAAIHNVTRFLSIVRTTGASLPKFESMAKTFVKKNPGLAPGEYQQQLMKNLMSGSGDLSQELLGAFSDPATIPSILSNVGGLLRGLAPQHAGNANDDADDEEGEDDDAVPDEAEERTDGVRSAAQIARAAKRKRRKAAKAAKAAAQNPIKALSTLLDDVKIDEDEMEELQEQLSSVLSPGGEGNAELQTMLTSLGDMVTQGTAGGAAGGGGAAGVDMGQIAEMMQKMMDGKGLGDVDAVANMSEEQGESLKKVLAGLTGVPEAVVPDCELE